MATQAQTRFDVGGVLLDQPFKIRRLGHFGYNVTNIDEGMAFYTDLLGFRVSDELDFGVRVPDKSAFAGLGPTKGFFMRYGGDHHAFVLFPRRVFEKLATLRGAPPPRPDNNINQITWQVGSLGEIGRGVEWFQERGIRIARSGRDMPGSNWHTYIFDPDGHQNELYFGIEQVGWDGRSKPWDMHYRGFQEKPALPQQSELDEVQEAIAKGIDLQSGYRHTERLPAKYDVDGILLPRPFKITRIGPVRLFVDDVAAAERFYREVLGFILTEEVTWEGQRCVFLRSNTEHHSLALYPKVLRERLDLTPASSGMAFGLQLASYRQLRDAVGFLREHGVKVIDNIPSALYPGIDYAAHVLDPDGNTIELYYYMEQIGWDGKPRPASQRRQVQAGVWPERLEPLSDVYEGEQLLGPWG